MQSITSTVPKLYFIFKIETPFLSKSVTPLKQKQHEKLENQDEEQPFDVDLISSTPCQHSSRIGDITIHHFFVRVGVAVLRSQLQYRGLDLGESSKNEHVKQRAAGDILNVVEVKSFVFSYRSLNRPSCSLRQSKMQT